MKKAILSLFVLSSLFQSCSSDDDNNNGSVDAPSNFQFTRDGASTVSFSGQTTRILMGEEFLSALKDPAKTEVELDGMFAHQEGNSDFASADLNASDKSLRSKTAASEDFFKANTTASAVVKGDFDTWVKKQVEEVFPAWNDDAAAGKAGKIQEAGGGALRYVNAKGLEYNQAINKGLIGALMVDQIVNNYLSPAVLDANNNVADNDAGVLVDGKPYTDMEHKWDEAFGFLYGTDNELAPELDRDSFLNKYLSRVEGDPDFAGIADDVYDAYIAGRAAIVAKDYDFRDAQADILKEKIASIIGIRSVYYLQQAKLNINGDKASAFHDLSEGFGFIYSLQFTRQPGDSTDPYFTRSEVEAFINTLEAGNGFWDLTPTMLDDMSNQIAAKFDFTVAEAASTK